MISVLQNISSSNDGLAGVFARNLMLAAGKTSYLEPVILPDGGLKSSRRDKYRGAKPPADVPSLKVYPNPAKNYFIAEYHLDYEPKGCFLEISDITGKNLGKVYLQGKENQKVVPINDYPTGIYIVSLVVNGSVIENVKLDLIR